jgi:hypothetical protein
MIHMVNSFFSRLVDRSIEGLKDEKAAARKSFLPLTLVPDGVEFEETRQLGSSQFAASAAPNRRFKFHKSTQLLSARATKR